MPHLISHIVFGDQEKRAGIEIEVKEMGTFEKFAELGPLPEHVAVLAFQPDICVPEIDDERFFESGGALINGIG
jgi:hypothetical protein